MISVYIIFSPTIDQFYIGHSENAIERLGQHNTGFFKDAHTSSTNDWHIVFELECANRTEAILIEKHIKKMKSKKYIQNLIKYPEMGIKLKQRYGSRS